MNQERTVNDKLDRYEEAIVADILQPRFGQKSILQQLQDAGLRGRHFSTTSLGQIFDISAAMMDEGQSPSLAAVDKAFREQNQNSNFDLYHWLNFEVDRGQVGASNADMAAELIDRDLREKLHGLIRHYQDQALNPKVHPHSLLGTLADEIEKLRSGATSRQTVTEIDSWSETLDYIEDERRKPEADPTHQVRIGLTTVDDVFKLMPQTLTIVAARTSVGKTSLALQAAIHQAMQGNRVFYFAGEMSSREMSSKVSQMATGIPASQMLSPHDLTSYQVEALCKEPTAYSGQIEMLNTKIGELPIEEIAAAIKAEHRKSKFCLVVIDQISSVRLPAGYGKTHEKIGEIGQACKNLAIDLEIPVIAVNQLNRGGEGQRPSLANMSGADQLNQDADNVILLQRDDRATDAVVHVEKHRNGPTGSHEVCFNLGKAKFVDAEIKAFNDYGDTVAVEPHDFGEYGE